jgi:hypothetical protein
MKFKAVERDLDLLPMGLLLWEQQGHRKATINDYHKSNQSPW